MRRKFLVVMSALLSAAFAGGATAQQAQTPAPTAYVLHPARVFDALSAQAHEGWAVLVQGDRIAAVGPSANISVPAGAQVLELPGANHYVFVSNAAEVERAMRAFLGQVDAPGR